MLEDESKELNKLRGSEIHYRRRPMMGSSPVPMESRSLWRLTFSTQGNWNSSGSVKNRTDTISW